MSYLGKDSIVIQGARQHNLKDISLTIPKDQLVVITGMSGSGKSSLAFSTLYAEGQRRYVESLSAYARQFLEMMSKPDVDRIEGLCPAISIEQKTSSGTPRSTVGTVTEIYDYLRLLFARVGVAHSPATGLPIEAQSRVQMTERILALPKGVKYALVAPIIRGVKGEHKKELEELKRRGYQRFKIDGQIYEAEHLPVLEKTKSHSIGVLVYRFELGDEKSSDDQQRILESVEQALTLSKNIVSVEPLEGKGTPLLLSAELSCPISGFSVANLEPRLFSFNSPYGACTACDGLGVDRWQEAGTSVHSEEEGGSIFSSEYAACQRCEGKRLKPEALCIQVHEKNIYEVCELSLKEAYSWVNDLCQNLSVVHKEIAASIVREIANRLNFLLQVGLDYLTLGRTSGTLSGGETQRIRLASQIGSGLTGVMYVLDEPSIGLHQRDNDRLISTLVKLRDLGNTVIVVEHDEDTILHADHVIDMGPKAGLFGGEVIFQGTPQQLLTDSKGLTGAYLRKEKNIPIPSLLRQGSGESIEVQGAYTNNLKNITVAFPLGKMMAVTGVSGGGKSSLVIDTLYRGLSEIKSFGRLERAKCQAITGLQHIDKVIEIDQSPIGRTPRSNPATYTGVFTLIREWFAFLPESRARGYTPGRFSFNVKGGRCEACQGDGVKTVEMHFLPDVYVTCEECEGRRYSPEILDIKYRGKSISDVLDMPISESIQFFEGFPSIVKRLEVLVNVGLGYLKIGQRAPTLSGGEAQRVKLAKELMRRGTGKTLYILDEPTTGLHFEDIAQLMVILHRIADQGNTVIVIEHNLEVIKVMDWVIDIGPEGGFEGGQIVAEGSPMDICGVPLSYTGKYLRPYFIKA